MSSVRVLVVDDSMMVRRQVGKALSEAGFVVVEAPDGQDALAKLEEYPDTALVVCDLNMPVMNGLEFLTAMKAANRRASVVILTTEGQPELMQRAKALGAKGWIIKPFKLDLLIAAAIKLTRASAA